MTQQEAKSFLKMASTKDSSWQKDERQKIAEAQKEILKDPNEANVIDALQGTLLTAQGVYLLVTAILEQKQYKHTTKEVKQTTSEPVKRGKAMKK